MAEIYVPVRPINSTTLANSVHNGCNNIRVGVTHWKNCRPSSVAAITAYPCEVKPNGIVSVVVTSGEDRVIEAMPRLNRKRLEVLESLTRNELSTQTGRAWELVQAICAKRGYEVIAATPSEIPA